MGACALIIIKKANVSCLVRLYHGLKGRLAFLGPNHRCTCLTGFTGLEWSEPGSYGLLSQVHLVLAMKEECGLLADS